MTLDSWLHFGHVLGTAGRGRLLLDRWILGYRLVLLVLVVAVWDMIFKPGL